MLRMYGFGAARVNVGWLDPDYADVKLGVDADRRARERGSGRSSNHTPGVGRISNARIRGDTRTSHRARKYARNIGSQHLWGRGPEVPVSWCSLGRSIFRVLWIVLI